MRRLWCNGRLHLRVRPVRHAGGRDHILYEPHVIAQHLGRDSIALQIGNQGAPRGLDVLGRLDDAPRVHADVRDVHERVWSGTRYHVRLERRLFGLRLLLWLGVGLRLRVRVGWRKRWRGRLGLFLFRRVGPEWTEDEMTSRSLNNLFEKDGRLAIIVKTETKHPGRSGKEVEKRLVLVVLEHLRDGEHPDDPVRLDVDEAEPVLFLQPKSVCARATVWRWNAGGETFAIASKDENASEV